MKLSQKLYKLASVIKESLLTKDTNVVEVKNNIEILLNAVSDFFTFNSAKKDEYKELFKELQSAQRDLKQLGFKYSLEELSTFVNKNRKLFNRINSSSEIIEDLEKYLIRPSFGTIFQSLKTLDLDL